MPFDSINSTFEAAAQLRGSRFFVSARNSTPHSVKTVEGHVSSSPQHLGYGLDEINIQLILLKHGFSCDPYRVCDLP